jgi:hypothetical protein
MTKARAIGGCVLAVVLVACGGSPPPATTTAHAGPHVAGVCHTPSLGVCQYYYEGDATIADAHTACTNSDVPNTSGSWLADCPSGNRIGDCNDPNGNIQARFYSGGTQYATTDAAQTACESDSGTWVP